MEKLCRQGSMRVISEVENMLASQVYALYDV